MSSNTNGYQNNQTVYAQSVAVTQTNYPFIATRDPTGDDTFYPGGVGKTWINTVTKAMYLLTDYSTASGYIQAVWNRLSGVAILTINGVGPNISGDVSLTSTDGSIIISPSPGTNTVDLAATPMKFPWTVVTVPVQPMTTENGYISNFAGVLSYTLPVTAAVGDVVAVTGINVGGLWQVGQNAGQQILIGNQATTVGAGGFIKASFYTDTMFLLCVVANTTFVCTSLFGNPTVA